MRPSRTNASSHRARPRRLRLAAFLAASLSVATAALAAGSIGASPIAQNRLGSSSPSTFTIFPQNSQPDSGPDSDTAAVEVGLRFRSDVSGWVTGIRYYKFAGSAPSDAGTLWDADGDVIARTKFHSQEGAAGWQTAGLSDPVQIDPGQPYVVSYTSPNGGYADDANALSADNPYRTGSLQALAGVYSYRLDFPTENWEDSNYYADVIFTTVDPDAAASNPSTSSPSTSIPATTSSQPRTNTTSRPVPSSASPLPTPTARTTQSTPPPTVHPSTVTTPSNPTSSTRASTTTATSPSTSASSSPGMLVTGWNLSASRVGLSPFGLKCSELPEYNPASNTVPAGTTIYRKRITGWLDLSEGNITVSQSCIQPRPGYVGQGSTSLTTWNSNRELQGPVVIEDSEYDGSLLNQHDQAWIGFFTGAASFYRNYVHNSGSGISTYGSYEKTGADVVIENNYVDHLIAYGDASDDGNHQSAYTVRDLDTSVRASRALIVRGNYFNCDGANTTAALFIQPNGGDVVNVTVEENLLAGNGFNLYLQQDSSRFSAMYSNVRAIDNRFSPTEYGPSLVRDGQGWTQWEQNYLYNAANTDGKGVIVPRP